MDKFWEDFETGEIHVRDKWQFELKSEFTPIPTQTESKFTQEFYIFIPNSLQINDQTYPKARFYEDQTNLIRYKTPNFSFSQLNNLENLNSPLTRLRQHTKKDLDIGDKPSLERELKLFANIFRSSLRDEAHQIVEALKVSNSSAITIIQNSIRELISQVQHTLEIYGQVKTRMLHIWTDPHAVKLFGYVRDYISIAINHSFSAVLESVRHLHDKAFQEIDETLCAILIEEKKYREQKHLEPLNLHSEASRNESILYQSGLLNKFFLDVLLLNTSRAAIDQKYRNLIGGIAAAVAMLVYILLFIWQGAVFVINSEPFILFTVIIYVLKDRLKDELKTLSFNQAFKWFSDYKTEIIAPSGRFVVGELKESFSFIDESNVPKAITEMRSREFHTYLETIKRPERVIYYKKGVAIFRSLSHKPLPRLHALNIIFRYDIHRFLAKASDPHEPHVSLDSETLELSHMELPKIYHINIILKNTLAHPSGDQRVELKKFRLVIDKDGIKRVENLASSAEERGT